MRESVLLLMFLLYGLFPLPDSDSYSDLDSDSKLYGYNSITQNMFPLTQTRIWIPFPNGYCTHVRDRSLSQGQISVPITYISIRGSESESELMEKSCTVQDFVSEFESESESGNGNKSYNTCLLVKH